MGIDTKHYLETARGGVEVELSEKETSKLGSGGGTYQLFDIGFLPPDKIKAHYCKECDVHYSGSPNIEVFIDKRDEASIVYGCKGCGDVFSYQYINSAEGIPIEFIAEDQTGKYKRPTPESIEKLLDQTIEIARKGEGRLNRGQYLGKLEIANKWAELISYEISDERVNEIQQVHRRSYLESIERDLPQIVQEIKKSSYGFNTAGERVEDISVMEGSGLYHRLEILLESLPHINVPKGELQRDVLRILDANQKRYENEKSHLEGEKSDLEKRIEGKNSLISGAENLVKEFVQRSGISNEDISKSREDPLSTFPGDYEEADDLPF